MTHVPSAVIYRASVFLGQHDGDDPLGDHRVGWVRRVSGEPLVEIIDFEKDQMAIGLKRAKVVFPVWVVGVAKIVVHRDGLDDPGDSFGAERGDASGHNGMAVRAGCGAAHH